MPETFNTDVSPSLHPSQIEGLDGYDDHKVHLEPARGALEAAYTALGRVHDARRAAATNSAWNADARLVAVAEFADQVLPAACAKFDSAVQGMTKTINQIDGELSRALEQDASRGPISAEIRAHVKALSVSERQAFLNLAHRSGDAITLRAVLGAPGYLSGLNEEERSLRTRAHHEQNQPQLAGQLAAMIAARDLLVERSHFVLGTEWAKAVGAPMMRVRPLQTAHRRASDALKLKVA